VCATRKRRAFTFHGSLAKLGVGEKLAAEELIDQWTVQFLRQRNQRVASRAFDGVEFHRVAVSQQQRCELDLDDTQRGKVAVVSGILRVWSFAVSWEAANTTETKDKARAKRTAVTL
jgi:hypothetical protein